MNSQNIGVCRCLLLAGAALLCTVVACGEKKPIRIGFSATLTGQYSDLGVHGRNGAQLAVEAVNAKGGVAGRRLELVIRDDKGSPEEAVLADKTLIADGVVAILGHMTSGQTLAALPTVEASGLVLFSPSSSTPLLKGKKDAFFRTVTTSDAEAAALGNALHSRNAQTAVVVIDSDNAGYTEPFAEAFEQAFAARGGQTLERIVFASRGVTSWEDLAKRIMAREPQALLIVASSRDTATLVQELRRGTFKGLLFGSGWARTGDLPKYGGRAVEGMIFGSPFNANSTAPAFLEFKKRYQERFGADPTFAAVYAYEAVLFLSAALELTGWKADGLKETLPGLRNIQGLMGALALDEFGDIERSTNIEEVRDGQFLVLDVIAP